MKGTDFEGESEHRIMLELRQAFVNGFPPFFSQST